jgi:hypothetical protein
MHIKKGVLDRIEETSAIIELEDGQKLIWDTDNLPPHFKEGQAIVLEIKTAEMLEKNSRELAENILHEIFNNTV